MTSQINKASSLQLPNPETSSWPEARKELLRIATNNARLKRTTLEKTSVPYTEEFFNQLIYKIKEHAFSKDKEKLDNYLLVASHLQNCPKEQQIQIRTIQAIASLVYGQNDQFAEKMTSIKREITDITLIKHLALVTTSPNESIEAFQQRCESFLAKKCFVFQVNKEMFERLDHYGVYVGATTTFIMYPTEKA